MILDIPFRHLKIWALLSLGCLWVVITACTQVPATSTLAVETPDPAENATLEWETDAGNILMQPLEFYSSAEALRIAETVLLHQSNNGGWPKNYDRIAELTEERKQALAMTKGREDTTFDNGSTYTEVRYLAKVYQATGGEQYKEAVLKGLDFMLEAQYENGGWPQVYPLDFGGYSKYITFNDDAMIGVMGVLRDVAKGADGQHPAAEYAFVDAARREKAAQAVQRGIDCILQSQIVVEGQRTAWCAQHDYRTLKPQQGRVYEYPSLSGSESVGIVRFLMSIESPSPEVIAAIEGAVAWFEDAKLTGIRVDEIYDDAYPEGYDLVVIEDETAPPLWARFYEIGTNKPIFADADGSIKETLAELSIERRTGYRWLLDKPAALLYEEYPEWQQAQQRQDGDGNSMARYILLALLAGVVLLVAMIGLRLQKRRPR